MRDLFKSLGADTRGGVLIYTAILMPIFLGFMALGLDIAAWHIEKRQSQTMADAAAVAAAVEDFIITGPGGTSPGCAAGAVFDAAFDAAGFNNFDAGEGHTLTLNCPPTEGVEGAYAAGSVEAVVTTPLPLFLASLVNVSVDGKSAKSYAIAGASFGNGCILSLNEENAGAIDVNGGSTVNIGCGIRSNSDDDDAIRLNGNGSCVTASEVISAGGTNGACYNPTPVEGVNPTYDPLESVPEPTNAGCTFNARMNLNGSADFALTPGTYCGDVSIRTSGTVTFAPGTYIFDSAGLSVGASANVIANDVMIVFTGGSNSNNFDISSGATWTQTAPSTGIYEGIAFWSRDANSYNINFTGGANLDVTGVIYAPEQDIKFAGGTGVGGSNTFIIADEITFTGNTTMSSTFDPNAPPFFSNFLVVGKLVE